MENKFYMVFVEGGGSPTYRHQTYKSAEDEAKRLATLTSKKTFVLGTIMQVEEIKYNLKNCSVVELIPDLPF